MEGCTLENTINLSKEDVMKTFVLSVFSIVVLAGAPLAAADAAPAAASSLCSPTPNPLLVDFEFNAQCTAIAQCAPFSNVSCSTGGTCLAVDRNCSSGAGGERGFVTCSGGTTYCGGTCCGSDGVCESSYGCGSSDPDCPCDQDLFCNFTNCGCSDPDCSSRPGCGVCELCSSITNCQSDKECSRDCPGSICTSSGICLCTG
jgi:hypothetical protein